MDYQALNKEDFDAVVTGELTHYALWMETELEAIVCDYFMGRSERREDFIRLFLHRDGLTFQHKIEIVRAMLPLFGERAKQSNLQQVLTQVENFKALRNALAHGRDVSVNESEPKMQVEIVSRSGKPKIVEITPESHMAMLASAEITLLALSAAASHLDPFSASEVIRSTEL